MYPLLMEDLGYSYSELLDKLIEIADENYLKRIEECLLLPPMMVAVFLLHRKFRFLCNKSLRQDAHCGV